MNPLLTIDTAYNMIYVKNDTWLLLVTKTHELRCCLTACVFDKNGLVFTICHKSGPLSLDYFQVIGFLFVNGKK